MEKSIKQWAQSLFDTIKHTTDNGDEYWLARELHDILGYSSWENFEKLLIKAKVSVAESGMPVENHFHDVVKMVPLGSGSERAVNDVELTRHACYVIAQNGSAAKKPAIAAAQAYFAIQTQRQEQVILREFDVERLIARRKYTDSDKHISEAIIEKGIDGRGLGNIKSSGDKVMFGGKATAQMKKQYGITRRGTPLANRMPNVILAAKTLANEMTATNLAQYPIEGYESIREENDDNNANVRTALGESNIVPEKMPPAEDTDQVLMRLQKEDKRKAIEESDERETIQKAN